MFEVIEDALIDSVKLLPFLFITYLIMEYIEHKTSDKSKEAIKKSGKFGPIIGSILGIFPQCGFSVSATNLYAARVITLGTLISVYLSTSDEMLPIFISEAVPVTTILKMKIKDLTAEPGVPLTEWSSGQSANNNSETGSSGQSTEGSAETESQEQSTADYTETEYSENTDGEDGENYDGDYGDTDEEADYDDGDYADYDEEY